MLELISSLSWVVHPLGGILLAFLASSVFSSRRRQSWNVLLGVLALVLLSLAGAGWLVHPAAGLTLALLASLIFRSWQQHRVTLLLAGMLLAVFITLGATWAVFPLVGFGMAWMFKVVLTGELFRTPQELRTAQAFPSPDQGAVIGALPARGGGDELPLVGTFGGRVAERVERRYQRRLAKLERKAGRLGVGLLGLQVQPPAPEQATPETGGLLALAREARLPSDVRARLGVLHTRCSEALAYLKDRGQDDGSQQAFLLRQIADDYAPEAVRAYLRLPPSLANVAPLQDGKTGRDLLGEQLDLLLNAVGDIMAQAAQANGQQLLAHQRFLKDRFAKENDELKL